MTEMLPWATRAFHWAAILLNAVWLLLLAWILVLPNFNPFDSKGAFAMLFMLQPAVPIVSILALLYGPRSRPIPPPKGRR